jgi:hypothetical protein
MDQKQVQSIAASTPEGDSFASLPPNLNGIAQLKGWEFREIKQGERRAGPNNQNVGEYYVYAYAIIVEPQQAQDFDIDNKPIPGQMVTVAGRRTQYFGALYDTNNNPQKPDPKKTRAGNFKDVTDTMKLLLGEGNYKPEDFYAHVVDASGKTPLERTAEKLVAARPYFNFRTWRGMPVVLISNQAGWWVGTKGATFPGPRWQGPFPSEMSARESKPNGPYIDRVPMTNEVWQGRDPAYVPKAAGASMNDASAYPASMTPNGPSNYRPESPPTVNVPAPQPVKPTEPEPAADQWDLPTAANLADEGNQAARDYVAEVARQQGWSEDDINQAPSFQSIADVILAASSETDISVSGPKVGSHWMYARVHPRTKKPGKPGEVEVVEVNQQGQTCAVKDLTTGNTWNGIPWTELKPI